MCQQMSGEDSETNTQYKRCANCRYFNRYTYDIDDTEIDSDYGECRRFPPKKVASEENGFPIISEDCWCGEFDD